MPTLGQSLSRMISDLTDLILKAPSGPQRDQLVAQQQALAQQLHVLIDETVDQNTAEYVRATAALQGANNALIAARADIQKVAETINKVAEVVAAVAEVAAKAAV
jgi:hypothetical protein